LSKLVEFLSSIIG